MFVGGVCGGVCKNWLGEKTELVTNWFKWVDF